MGVYFIAAGTSDGGRNRSRSLERSFILSEFKPYLSSQIYNKLSRSFDEGDAICVWGATKPSGNQLRKVEKDDYVVDVKNKVVVQVFRFCFHYPVDGDLRIQDYIGWDAEKPASKRRIYDYVFFLKDPQPVKHHIDKNYFRNAFGYQSKYWLTGQQYFKDHLIFQAMERTGTDTIEAFLGIAADARKTQTYAAEVSGKTKKRASQHAATYAAAETVPSQSSVSESKQEFDGATEDIAERKSLWARFVAFLKRLFS